MDLPLIVSACLSYGKTVLDFGNISSFPTRGNAEYQNIVQQAFNIENTRRFFSMYPQNSETQKVKAIRKQV